MKNSLGFTLIEVLVVAAITGLISTFMLINFQRTRVDLNVVSSVFIEQVRALQAKANASSKYDDGGGAGLAIRCGYGIHYVNPLSYSIYAGPVASSVDCSVLNKNYGSGDTIISTNVFTDSGIEFKGSFADIFFEPPDPKTYINNVYSLSSNPEIVIIGKTSVDCSEAAVCKSTCLYSSGKVEDCSGATPTPTTTPTPTPTVSINANPNPVSYNTASTLSWSSTDATDCTASNAWSGSKPTSGAEGTGNLTSNQTYTLTCSGPGGSAFNSVTVTVSAPPTWTLTVSKAGTGSGTVTGNGIDCGVTCSSVLADGTITSLTATPAGSGTFTGWSGACSGTGSCITTMNSDKSVTATFTSNAVTSATGGTITTSGGYTIHTFTSNGTFNVTSIKPSATVEVLIVGGGGGSHVGGGGAGGVIINNSVPISIQSYPVVIGAGGNVCGNGQNSSAISLAAVGGGGDCGGAGFAGGSGGGGYPSYSGGSGTAGQGYAGGAGGSSSGGGGGGATGVGSNGGPNRGGSGGNGISSSISGGSVNYGGGGGGGGSNESQGSGGGAGGGGDGNSSSGNPGTPNTGGGAGGGWYINGNVGGSGIVIIRYIP